MSPTWEVQADPVIMYQAICPSCAREIILYREDADQPVQCEYCHVEFNVTIDEDEGEVIYDASQTEDEDRGS